MDLVTAPDRRRPAQAALFPFLFVAVVLIAGCTATDGEVQDNPGQDSAVADGEARIARLSAAVPDLLLEHDVPGLTLCLIHDGVIAWTGAFGVRRIRDGAPMLEDTILEGSGLALAMLAHAVVQLDAEQILDLDRPLVDVLPVFAGDDPRMRQITARMLLSHTSGLSGGPLDRSTVLATDPGTAFQITLEGQRLLQQALEQVTGETLDVTLERLVFRPLDMSDTSMVWRPDYDIRASGGHALPSRTASTARRKQRPELADAPTSLHTTAEDVARFVIGTVGEATSYPEVEIDRGLNLSFGLGWARETTPRGGSIFQWGANPFFRAFVLFTPTDGNGLVVLSNCESGLELMGPLVEAYDGREHGLFDSSLLHPEG